MRLETHNPTDVTKEVKVYSVTEISNHIKALLGKSYPYVKIRGEISSIFQKNGHTYINLKDASSMIKVVTFAYQNIRLSAEIKDGVEVICTGALTSYGASSCYQLHASAIEISGEGELLAILERRKKEYEIKGYFSQDRKKALPLFPRIIGIITSIQGAVIRDIVNTLSQRIPTILFIFDVSVQGQFAALEVCNALQKFQSLPKYADLELNDFISKTSEEVAEMNFHDLPQPDILIIARGGGSVSELWTFNEEAIIEEIYRCTIPIISGIGHETDNTLSDYVADRREHTPTAAAVAAVKTIDSLQYARTTQDVVYTFEKKLEEARGKLQEANSILERKYKTLERNIEKFSDGVYFDLKKVVDDINYQLNSSRLKLESKYERIRSRIDSMYASMCHIIDFQCRSADSAIQQHRNAMLQGCKRTEERLRMHETTITNIWLNAVQNMNLAMVQIKHLLDMHNQKLSKFNYKDTLKRGFAVVRDKDGYAVQAKDAVSVNSMIEIEVSDGYISALVKDNSKSK
ncbi:Exodeoxyribonuclease 7 large subunit [Candidatus Fokinia solitaria]|uniref:Exodeoxyribonuclease 7 large subunit n=1 Tax=Candidatus Fokinia solitaria TaxID=1802984 RepID=A0A2U8BRU1_9RICK|nr:exodeoxyribonuclease VII large subunit [Candidatus Fokinia solitaria]AWD33052.1 Exodeoxyribonuclease 7 large subunit [Candidatus Fokinia solitaria]